MTIAKKKKYFIIGTLVLSFVVIFLLILPAAKELKKITNEVNERKAKLEELYAKNQFLKPTQERYKTIEPKVSELSKIFVYQNQELNLITALEKIALTNHVAQEIEWPETTAEKTKKETNYQVLPLNIKITGAYINFLKYLEDLESLDYYINIYNLKISTQNSASTQTISTGPQTEFSVSVLIQVNIFKKTL